MRNVWKNTIVCLLVAVVFLTPTSAIINDDSRQDNIYREVIIKFTEDKSINSPNIKKLNEKYHIHSIEKVFTNCEDTSLDNIYLLLVPEKSNINVVIKDFLSLPDVEYAESNYVRKPISLAASNNQEKNSDVQKVYPYLNQMDIPNDPDFEKQWSLDNTGQTGGSPDADIDAPEAWEIETGNPEIVIAIVDSGIDYTHPDLAGNIWINNDEIPDNDIDDDNNGFVDDYYGYDFTGRGDPDPKDTLGHGTHCAGVAGAVTNNNLGIAGVCWNCKLMSVRVFQNTSAAWSWTANGIRYAADNGAHVISMSFGWYDPADVLKDAIDYAYDKGTILVAAAGNEGVMSQLYPAAYENVIAVAATDHNDQRMNRYDERFDMEFMSNFGFWVDVSAPGQDIYSTLPTYNFYFGDEYGLKKKL